MLPFLAWWLLVVLMGMAAFPLTAALCRSLPDRGYPLARGAGLLAYGYGYWLLASLGFLANRPASLWAAFLALLVVGGWGWSRSPDLRRWLRQRRWLIVASELVFLLAFGLWTVVRAYDPAAQGTEKPMELAFLNSVLESPAYPPQDPWLAGYAISYYYLGYVLVGVLAGLAGTAGAVAFNLGLALVFGLTVSFAWSLVANLASLLTGRSLSRVWGWGGAGALAVAVLGNLEGFLELLHGKGIGTARFYEWLDIRNLAAAPPMRSWYPEDYWWWWRASRVVRDRFLGADQMVIDEFPFFSFLLGDLHPHVLSLPFTLLALTLVLAILLQGRGLGQGLQVGVWGRPTPAGWHWRSARALAVAALLAGLAFLNPWDYPTYAGLAVAAVAVSGPAARPLWRRALPFALLLAGVAILVNLPQLLSFRAQTRGVGLVLLVKTQPQQFLVVFGLLLYPVLWFLLSESWARGRSAGRRRVSLALAGAWLVPALLLALLNWWVSLFLWLALGLSLFVLLGPAEDATRRYLALLAAAAFLVMLAVEFVFIRDVFGTRMNTVFKFYYQGWVLLAVSGAAATAYLWQRLTRWPRVLFALPLAALVLAGAYYPVAATYSKTAGFRGWPSLNGMAYLERAYPGDYQAILWLREHAPPGSVVLEAAGWEQYGHVGRFATFTGLPAVLGWGGHQTQWGRSGELVGGRVDRVREVYETGDAEQARKRLDELGVSLVVVGEMERQRYQVQEGKFAAFLTPVYQRDGVTIYSRPGWMRG